MIGSGLMMARRCVGTAAQQRRALRMQRMQQNVVPQRAICGSAMRLHGNHDHEDFVVLGKAKDAAAGASPVQHTAFDDDEDEDDDDMVDTVAIGPSGVEYGGPQRGGKFKEPTRFGDWERKGRCTDF